MNNMKAKKYITLKELIEKQKLKPHLLELICGVAETKNGFIHVYISPDNEYYTTLKSMPTDAILKIFSSNNFTHELVRGYGSIIFKENIK